MAPVEEPAPTDDAASEDELRFQAWRALPFTVFDDDIGTIGRTETRQIITSAEAYRRLFGSVPTEVDFRREWVVFYSAGEQPTGGYVAAIDAIRLSWNGQTLVVETSLATPGEGCVVTQALTTPYVFARFPRPRLWPRAVRYQQDTYARDCVPTSGCAAVLCLEGTACVVDPDGEPRCSPLCATDADCRAEADYCTGCHCLALGPREEIPACEGPGVRCFADPCMGKTAVCRDQVCTIE